MRPEEFLEGWSSVSGVAVTPAQRVWVDRYCRDGSALLEFKSAQKDAYLLLVARDRARARQLEFVVRKAFALGRLQPLWAEAENCVSDAQRARLENLGVGSWSIYKIEDRVHVGAVYGQLTMVELNRLPSAVQWQSSTGALIRSLRGAVGRGDRATADQLLLELRGRVLTDRFQHDFLALWSRAKLEPASVLGSEELRSALEHKSPGIPTALLQIVGDVVVGAAVFPALEHGGGAARLVEELRQGNAPMPGALIERGCILDSEFGALMRVLVSIRDQKLGLWEGDRRALEGSPGGCLLEYLPEAPGGRLAPPAEEPGAPQASKYSTFERAEKELLGGGLGQVTALALVRYHESGELLAGRYLREWWESLELAERQERAQEVELFSVWLGADLLGKGETPQDWLSWLQSLSAGSAQPDEGGAGFSYEDLPLVPCSSDRASLAALTDVLEVLALKEEAVGQVLEVLPEIFRAWGTSDLAPADSGRLAEAVGAVLEMGVLYSEDTLNARHRDDLLFQFFEVGIRCGMSLEAYRSVVKALAKRVEELQSLGILAPLMDLFELLTDQPRAHGESYQRLAMGFYRKALQFHKRLKPDVVELIADLAQVAGLKAEAASLLSLIPDDDSASTSEELEVVSLEGKKVLIYTLVEPAGHRAKAKIEATLKATVRLNFDHEASAALKAALDWADIVICVTRAAQHAATNEIDLRVDKAALIRPAGKGSSGIWNALSEWRQRQTA